MFIVPSKEKVRKSITIKFPELSEDAFVKLATLSYGLVVELKQTFDDTDMTIRAKFFKDNLASVVIDHNLYKDESTKMSAQEVIDFIYDDWELMAVLVKEYTDFLFFTPKAETAKA